MRHCFELSSCPPALLPTPLATTVPQRRGRYWYYSVHSAGKQYRRYCRRLIADLAAAPSEHDSMDLQQAEEVLLDQDELAGLPCRARFAARCVAVLRTLRCWLCCWIKMSWQVCHTVHAVLLAMRPVLRTLCCWLCCLCCLCCARFAAGCAARPK